MLGPLHSGLCIEVVFMLGPLQSALCIEVVFMLGPLQSALCIEVVWAKHIVFRDPLHNVFQVGCPEEKKMGVGLVCASNHSSMKPT